MLALPYKRFLYRFDGDFLVNGKPLLLNPAESRDSDSAVHGDTGCAVWDSAVFFVRFLETHPQYIRGKHVLELGAGLGLCGIACAHLGASKVTLSDLGYILPTSSANVIANQLENTVQVLELDWHYPATSELIDVEVVIASDIIWLECLVAPLVNVLADVNSRFPNACFLFANQRRSDSVWNAFKTLSSPIFQLEILDIDGNLEIYRIKPYS